MRRVLGILLLAAGTGAMQGQSVVSQGGSTQATSTQPAGKAAVAGADTRTEKQKALAMQTERLFAMATELKAQVDLTNKNILSLKVVEKAQEIEALAKGMRGQAKK